ncbi:VOC family protein [Seohaeicola nanhaiensis]|uniref:VOC family protein n=1 Tax=Seohaeicola nanhaiensis TaxID=1387282 RepID=A0ABV9KA94_9RHOB
MNTYINLCVADVKRSRSFFTALGFAFNDNFSDAESIAMRISDSCFVMMLQPGKFKGFTPREIADATRTTEVMTALQLDSRAAVDAMVEAAVAAGGSVFRAAEEHGFMYGRSFCDPDGHVWEPFWFDPAAVPENPS